VFTSKYTFIVFVVPFSACFDFIEVSFYATTKMIYVEKEDSNNDQKNNDYVFHVLNLRLFDLLIERSVTFS
jgi:hypothetical protein